MNADKIIGEINSACAPDKMSKKEAKDFLEEICSHIECQLDAMGEEDEEDQ